jgi:hypothetical protein
MLPCLIDDSGGEQLCRIELAHGESFQPRFVSAGMALELGPIGVPELDVHAVRTALAEEKDGHRKIVYRWGEEKAKVRLSIELNR